MSWDGGNVFHFKQYLSSETNFEYDIRNNRLPKYSFIEPRYTDTFGDGPVNSSHPGGGGYGYQGSKWKFFAPADFGKGWRGFVRASLWYSC